jgi:hypothetical protein
MKFYSSFTQAWNSLYRFGSITTIGYILEEDVVKRGFGSNNNIELALNSK